MLTAIKPPLAAPDSYKGTRSSLPGIPSSLRPTTLRATKPLVPAAPPASLKLLMVLQRSSTPVTLGLGVLLLGVYGWSVYTQRSWSQAYSHLNQLQRDERQLMAANEVRKYQVTEQAETMNRRQFVPQGPANTIFLKPESPRPTQPKVSVPLNSSPDPLSPVGY